MSALTEDQKTKLYTAIDRAIWPNGCQYEFKGKPCCIIGQLAFIEGNSIKALKMLDKTQGNLAELVDRGLCPKLKDYPIDFLMDLQTMWDTTTNFHAKTTKDEMKERVERCLTMDQH